MSGRFKQWMDMCTHMLHGDGAYVRYEVRSHPHIMIKAIAGTVKTGFLTQCELFYEYVITRIMQDLKRGIQPFTDLHKPRLVHKMM